MEKLTVGFAGLGTMGAFMAANVARRGFPLKVWNRSAERAEPLVAQGAERASTPRELGEHCDVVITCVTDADQVREVLFGDQGLAEGMAPSSLYIDCSTISPIHTQHFAKQLASQGVSMLDAPVSGGSEGARNATLSIFVGGESSDVERARPVLEAMGAIITHLGPVGSGQWTKAVNQVILAGTYLGVAEGIALALKAGLDVEKMVASLAGGAADSWVLRQRSAAMINDKYPLGFKVSLHRKDLGIALELAREVGAVTPVAALAATFEDGLVAQGFGNDDVSALARVVRQLSGL